MLKSACKVQKEVIESAKAEGGNVEAEKKLLGSLYMKVARYLEAYEKNSEDTLNLLVEANKIFPENTEILEMMASINFREGELEKCQARLEVLQKLDPRNDTASSLMAEIMLRSNNYEKAVQQFQRILGEKPDNYPVLAKLIDFFRRNNQLAAVQEYIARAERKASNFNDPGLCFCRGVLHKYSRSPRLALAEFNKGKKSAQWAEQSLVHMIDIYLNPDQDLLYTALDEQMRQVDPDNIGICEAFLKEMAIRASSYRFRAMEGLVNLLAGRSSPDQVAQNMIEILRHVPC
jgi:tetratricopeptide repeat protein 21B